jgi:hypothetical protein
MILAAVFFALLVSTNTEPSQGITTPYAGYASLLPVIGGFLRSVWDALSPKEGHAFKDNERAKQLAKNSTDRLAAMRAAGMSEYDIYSWAMANDYVVSSNEPLLSGDPNRAQGTYIQSIFSPQEYPDWEALKNEYGYQIGYRGPMLVSGGWQYGANMPWMWQATSAENPSFPTIKEPTYYATKEELLANEPYGYNVSNVDLSQLAMTQADIDRVLAWAEANKTTADQVTQEQVARAMSGWGGNRTITLVNPSGTGWIFSDDLAGSYTMHGGADNPSYVQNYEPKYYATKEEAIAARINADKGIVEYDPVALAKLKSTPLVGGTSNEQGEVDWPALQKKYRDTYMRYMPKQTSGWSSR